MSKRPPRLSQARIEQEIRRRRITPEVAGESLEDLAARALQQDDPLAFLDTFALGSDDVDVEASEPPPVAAAVEPAAPKVEPAALEVRDFAFPQVIPLGLFHVEERTYISEHVEARFNMQHQKLAMRKLLLGLKARGARTRDGRLVETNADCVRWLMDRLAEAAPAA
jgi:hypothetical protein